MQSHVKKSGGELLLFSVSAGDIHDVVHLLEEDEVDIMYSNVNGQTALHFAVMGHNFTMIELLLQFQANPNIQDNLEVGFNTPLHIATDHNQLNIIELLLDKGGNPSIQNKCGFTCLHIAARNGFLEMTKLLKAKGVDQDIRDHFQNNAAYWAKEYDHHDVMALLTPPLKVSKEEFTEYMEQIWADAGVDPGKKKGKKGKKGKKKKK